jgi:micrococcal nuclease
VRTRRLQLVTAAAAAILVALIAVRPGPAAVGPEEGTLRGTVVTVHDGDTIRVRLDGGPEETVRLIGVNSQELDDAREAVRLMAFLAKRFTFGRLYRAKVTLLPGPEARDSYGRLLAFVRTADGDLFNVTLVREGYAFAYLKFPFDEALRKELKAAEEEARQAGRGLWRRSLSVIRGRRGGRDRRRIFTVVPRLRSFKRGGFHLLEADGGAFDAAVPLSVFRSLPGSLDFEGRTIEATGFIELYKGRSQIMIGVPAQLRSAER